MSKEIHMENVRDISLEALELIEKRLKEFGIELNDQELDEIYVPLSATLEKLAKYPDYANYN